MFGQIKIRIILLFPVLIAVWLGSPNRILAQAETPYDLINAINDLRALHALGPYQIDPWLMTYAQEHSEYQATIKQGTHLHRDGKLPQEIGLQENVASGDIGVMTVSIVVFQVWASSWGHLNILIGYSTGEIGAGIARSDDGQVYYTVDIRPGEKAETDVPGATPFSYAPLETAVPDKDCSITHIVGYGQSLWSIAQVYGVTIDTIRNLNHIAGDSTIIQVGQKLLIRPACSPTSPPPTQNTTHTPSATVEVVTPLKTTLPLSTATESTTYLEREEKNSYGVILFIAGMIGILIAGILGFIKARGKPR